MSIECLVIRYAGKHSNLNQHRWRAEVGNRVVPFICEYSNFEKCLLLAIAKLEYDKKEGLVKLTEEDEYVYKGISEYF